LYIDIEKAFPDFKLSVQLEGHREVIALLGGSGCGKSLTLKCIAGIEKPDRGRIVINGETVFDSDKRINISPQKRHVGYLFQNYALFPTMTVWNNISCVIRKPRAERHSIVENIIKKFQIEGVKNLYPRQISGGQQQRTALARILVSEPRILMLDEPFSALDTHLKWRMEQEISSVLSEFDGVAVIVSHDRDEVYRMSGKVAIMNNGNIESLGAKEDVFGLPKTLAAAMMTGCKNISKAEKLGDFRVKALDWGVDLETALPVLDSVRYVGIRAHHFKQANAATREGNTFTCRIRKIIEEPFERIFMFSFNTGEELGSDLLYEVSKDVCPEIDLNIFALYVPPDKIMCLE